MLSHMYVSKMRLHRQGVVTTCARWKNAQDIRGGGTVMSSDSRQGVLRKRREIRRKNGNKIQWVSGAITHITSRHNVDQKTISFP